MEILSSVRQRFIESIEYLRKLGFFEEYSNLASEGIFENMREKDPLLRNLEEGRWMKESFFEIDSYLIISDKKRVWTGFDFSHIPSSAENIEILKKLAEISRGVFQPLRIEGDQGQRRKISFLFNGKKYVVEFSYTHHLYLDTKHVLSQINKIIENTGYQYYELACSDLIVVVLTREEKEKLESERCWKFRVY